MPSVEVPEEVDKLVAEVAKKYGMKKSDVLKILLEQLTGEGKEDNDIEKLSKVAEELPTGGSLSAELKDVFTTAIQSKILEKVLNDGGGLDRMLEKLLTIQIVKQLMQPDPLQMLLIERTLSAKETKSDTEKEIIRMIQQQQQTTMQMLLALLGSNRKEEEMEKKFEMLKAEFDKTVNTIVQYIQSMNIKNDNDLLSKVEELKRTKEALDQLQELFGPKTPVVTEEGKPNPWALLDRGFELAKEIIRRLPQEKPQMKQVQTLPTSPFPTIQAQQPIAYPKEEQETANEEITVPSNNIINVDVVSAGGSGSAGTDAQGQAEILEPVEGGSEENTEGSVSSGDSEEKQPDQNAVQ